MFKVDNKDTRRIDAIVGIKQANVSWVTILPENQFH